MMSVHGHLRCRPCLEPHATVGNENTVARVNTRPWDGAPTILLPEWPYDRQPHARPLVASPIGATTFVPCLRDDQLLQRRNSPAVRAATSRRTPHEPAQGRQTARTESEGR